MDVKDPCFWDGLTTQLYDNLTPVAPISVITTGNADKVPRMILTRSELILREAEMKCRKEKEGVGGDNQRSQQPDQSSFHESLKVS